MKLFNFILLFMCILQELLTVKGFNDTFGKVFVFAVPITDDDALEVKMHFYNIEFLVRGSVSAHRSGRESPLVEKRFEFFRDNYTGFTFESVLDLLDRKMGLWNNYTFVVSCDSELSLTLNMISRGRWASTQLVPVEGWGRKYFAVTLRNSPFILVVTYEPNMARITLYSSDPVKFRIQIESNYYGHGDGIGIEMIRNSTYRIELCDHLVSITGTIVEGLKAPLGVISGNCNGYSYNGAEACRDDFSMEPPHGFNVEMLLPYETFGKEFHTFRELFGYYLIVPSESDTVVYLHIGGEEITNVTVTLSAKEVHHTVRPSVPLVAIRSTKPVQVIFIKLVECSSRYHDTNHDLAMTVVVPTTLFMNVYYLRIINFTDVEHFAIAICHVKDRDNFNQRMYLDGQQYQVLVYKITRYTFYQGLLPGWLAVQIVLVETIHMLHMDNGAKFGLYVYGIGKTRVFMYPGGFILARLNPKTCHGDTMRKGDKLDNDCDERVDEEVRDDLDNDDDGRVDEDLGYPVPRNGGWGEGVCVNCSQGSPALVRSCDNPRPGHTGKRCSVESLWINYNDGKCIDLCERLKEGEYVFPPTTALTHTFFSPDNFKYTLKEATILDLSSTEPSALTAPTGSNASTTTATTSNGTAEPKVKESETIGTWGSWSEWECSTDCKDTRLIRTRKCDNPDPSDDVEARCYGQAVIHKEADCNAKCPEECPVGTWGMNCQQGCENCDPDCNKRNGTCQICKPGFHYPHLSCSKACGNYTYGFMCTGDCAVKCNGKDCLEREIGVCPAAKLIPSMYWLLVLVIPISLLLVLRFRRSRSGKSPKTMGQSSRSETQMKSSLMSSGSKGAMEDNVSQSSGHTKMWQNRKPVKQAISADKLNKVSEERTYQYDETFGTNV